MMTAALLDHKKLIKEMEMTDFTQEEFAEEIGIPDCEKLCSSGEKISRRRAYFHFSNGA